MTVGFHADILPRMSRFFGIALKSLALLIALTVLLLGVAVWQLSSNSISSTTLTPYVEMAFERFVPGSDAKIEKTSFEWDSNKFTLSLSCEGVRLVDARKASILSFPSVSLKLRLGDYLSGRVLPREMKANGAKFWLTRHKDGHFTLGAGQKKENAEAEPKTDGGIDVFSFIQNISDEIASEYARQDITIKNVEVAVNDLATSHDWAVQVPEISLAHNRKNVEGKALIEVTQKDNATLLQANYSFDHVKRLHHVSLGFQDIWPTAMAPVHPLLAPLKSVGVPLSGEISFATDRELNISQGSLKIDGGKGALIDQSLWDKPRGVERVTVRATFDEKTEKVVLSQGEIDFGGPKLFISGEAKVPAGGTFAWLKTQHGNPYTLSVKLQDLPMDQFDAVWPKVAVPDARNWIVLHMSKGMFTQGQLSVSGKIEWDKPENLTIESGGGTVSAKGGNVTYLEGMPAVENADAEGTFDLKHMDVKLLKGNTGPIKIQPFTLTMTHFEEDTQYITIPVRLIGPAQDVLRLLDSPPLGYAKAIGLDSNDASGQVEGTLTLHMPMLDSLLLKDVEVKANANLTGFGAKKLIPGIEISQGNFELDVTKDGFGLKGPLVLNKLPGQLIWKSRFAVAEKSKEPMHEAEVTATIKGDHWSSLGLEDLIKTKGDVSGLFHYAKFRDQPPTLKADLNFRQAAVQVDELGWKKAAGITAQLGFVMQMPEGQNIRINDINLQGTNLRVKGTAELEGTTRKLVSANLKPYVIGRSNAAVTYNAPADQTQPVLLKISGDTLDISGFGDDKEQKEEEKKSEAQAASAEARNQPKQYDIKLNRLVSGENSFMTNLAIKARRDKIGWSELDVYGLAQGTVPVDVKLKPEAGILKLAMRTEDFGAAMKGLGFSDAINGGLFEASGESQSASPRTINGKIKISSFTVADLPVLARLLSAVSPFGFMDLITGDASFNSLRGHFKWTGDDIELSEVRAAGSVVGINVDGKVNLETGKTNLNGTVVPFSFMNSIIGSIPLLGDVITGGSGQGVIAAAFTVHGTMSEPNVSVNPISLLTPGFLRNLFFGAEEEEAPQKEMAPEKAPKGSQPK